MNNFNPVLILLTLFISASCSFTSSNNNNQICDYQSEKFNMKIISIQSLPEDSTMFTIMVDFDGNIPYAEQPQNLMDIRNVHTDLNFLTRNNVRVGQIYKGTLYMLKEDVNNCQQQIFDWDNKLK